MKTHKCGGVMSADYYNQLVGGIFLVFFTFYYMVALGLNVALGKKSRASGIMTMIPMLLFTYTIILYIIFYATGGIIGIQLEPIVDGFFQIHPLLNAITYGLVYAGGASIFLCPVGIPAE